MNTPAESILRAAQPGRIAAAVTKIAPAEIAAIDASLALAMAGDPGQVRTYVAAYRGLADRVVDAADREPGASDAFPLLRSILAGEAMNAPFSPWIGALGPGRGTAVAMVAALRRMQPGAEPPPLPARPSLPDWDIDDGDVVRFYRAVSEALEAAEAPLDRIRAVLGLNRTELAALFGVKRQALEHWQAHLVPAERQAKLATLAAIADLLARELKPDRVAGMVRRPAPAYGDRSVLEAIAAGEQDVVLSELRDSFDWASAA